MPSYIGSSIFVLEMLTVSHEPCSQAHLLLSLIAACAARAGAAVQGIPEARCSAGGPCARPIVSNEWGIPARTPSGSPTSGRQGTRAGAACGAQASCASPRPAADQAGSPLKRVRTTLGWPASAPVPDPDPGPGLEPPSPAGVGLNGRVQTLARTSGEGAHQDQRGGLVAARGHEGLGCRVMGLPPASSQGNMVKGGEGLCGMSPSGSGVEDSLLHCLLQGASSPLSTLSKDPQVRHISLCLSSPSVSSSSCSDGLIRK